MNEVPRRQSTGCRPWDVVAEIEDGVEAVYEGEMGDGVEPGIEIESAAADTRLFHWVSDRSILRFVSMAAPKFSAAQFHTTELRIANARR